MKVNAKKVERELMKKTESTERYSRLKNKINNLSYISNLISYVSALLLLCPPHSTLLLLRLLRVNSYLQFVHSTRALDILLWA